MMGKVKKFFKENYSKCWEFAVESKWFFVFSFAIFALTFLIGFAFPVFFRERIFDIIESLILNVEELETLGLIFYIFMNNLEASFFAFVLGVGVGILPLITCVANGYLLGFVAREAVMIDGIFSMWKIFPHGIFELPAVIFSIGMGLKLGATVIAKLKRNGKNREGIDYVFREGLRFFVFVVIPLLVIAGIIEGILIGIMK